MNFLSHGVLVHRTGSAHLLIGSALPDLAPLADLRLRMTSRRLARLRQEGASEVVAGCLHHRQVDRVFHASAAFHEAQQVVLDALAEDGNAFPRTLLAHMLVEIGIDAEVLHRYPEFARQTYPDAFAAYDWPWLMGRLQEATGSDPAALEELISRFDGGSFLLSYERDDGVLNRLAGMVWRVLGREVPPDTRQALLPAITTARRIGREWFDRLMPWELELREVPADEEVERSLSGPASTP